MLYSITICIEIRLSIMKTLKYFHSVLTTNVKLNFLAPPTVKKYQLHHDLNLTETFSTQFKKEQLYISLNFRSCFKSG